MASVKGYVFTYNADTASRRMPQMPKMLSRSLGSILALLIIVPSALYFYLNAFSEDDIKRLLRESVAEVSTAQFDVLGAAEVQFFPQLGFSFENAVLRHGESNQAIASLKEISLNIDWTGLFKGDGITVNYLTLRGMQIDLVRAADGTANWDVLRPEEKPQASTSKPPKPSSGHDHRDHSGMQLAVDKILIEDSHLHFVDEKNQQEWNLDLTLIQVDNANLGEQFPVNAQIKIAEKSQALNLPLSLSSLVVIKTENDSLTLNQFAIDSGTLHLSGTGKVIADSVNLKLELARFDLKSWLSTHLGYKLELQSETALQQLGLKANFAMQQGIVEINDLMLQLDQSQFTGNIYLDDSQDLVKIAISGDSLNVDNYLPKAATPAAATSPNSSQTPPATSAPTPAAEQPLFDPAIFNNLNLNAVINLKLLTAIGLELGDLTAHVQSKNNILAAQVDVGKLYGGDIKNQVTLNSQDPNKVTWQLNSAGKQIDIKGLSAALKQDIELTGTSQLSAKFNSQGLLISELLNNVAGQAQLKINDGSVGTKALKGSLAEMANALAPQDKTAKLQEQQNFTLLDANINLTKGLKDGQQLSLIIDNLELSGNGGIDLDQQKINYQVISYFNTATAAQTFSVSPYLEDTSLPIDCVGSLTGDLGGLCKPRLKEIVRQQFDSRGEEKLDQLLEEKVPEELRDSAKQLLKGLFGGRK